MRLMGNMGWLRFTKRPESGSTRLPQGRPLTLRAVRGTLLVLAVGLVSGAGIVSPGAESLDDKRMLASASEPSNWLVEGGSLDGKHWSSLDQINEKTVAKLPPAWSFDFDTTRGQESEPIVVDGVMYVTSAWSKVFALDAATGGQIWS